MKIIKKRTLKIAFYASNGASNGGFHGSFQWGFQWNKVLLLGAVLLSFQFVGNLQAQDSQTSKIGKGGWFIGLTPYALGLSESKTSARITSNPTGVTTDSGAGFSFTAVAPSDANLGATGSQAHAQAAAVSLCKTGFAIPATDNTDATNTDFGGFRFAPADGTYDGNVYQFNVSTHCRDYFAGLLANATQVVPFQSPEASKPATAKWSGAGLHFGWQFPEGDRVGLQLHNWKGDGTEVSSQIAIYDYFFPKGFYAGLGIGTLQLKALGKTESQRATAVNLGWQYSIKENLKLELGYLLLNGEVTVKKETRATRNVVISRAEVPTQVVYLGFHSASYSVSCVGSPCSLLGDGVRVTSEPLTREISGEQEIIETQEVTVSKPSVIYIRLSLSF